MFSTKVLFLVLQSHLQTPKWCVVRHDDHGLSEFVKRICERSEFSAVQFFSRANFQPCNFSAVQSFTRAASQVSLVCIFCGQQGHVLWKTKVLNDQLQLFQDIQSSKLNSN
jgi:hypothetical protein